MALFEKKPTNLVDNFITELYERFKGSISSIATIEGYEQADSEIKKNLDNYITSLVFEDVITQLQNEIKSIDLKPYATNGSLKKEVSNLLKNINSIKEELDLQIKSLPKPPTDYITEYDLNKKTSSLKDSLLFELKKYIIDNIPNSSFGVSVMRSKWGNIKGDISDQTDLQAALDEKQDALVSGTNIKTINGSSILGGGNLVISGGGAVDSVNGQTGVVTLIKSDIGLNNVDNTSDLNKPISTATQTALDSKVDENTAITGATKTKITYDTKGLVTSGADATTADIADSLNKRYVTDAQLTIIGNTSGTNTGDQNLFSTIVVSGQSNVVADSTSDTLTLVAGANVTITTDAATDSITIASTGGSASPAGSDTSIQYNNAGSFGGATNVKIENGNLRLDDNSTPAVPASDGVNLFGRKVANRMLPAFIAPSGLDSALQPLLARNKVGYWNPPGNATTVPGVFGFTAPTVTGFTATARNVATTNAFTRMRRLGYVTAATAGTVGQWRLSVAQYTVGDSSTNLGGFTYIIRFGISDAATVAGARMFIGVRISATPTNVEPNTLTNCIGVGHGASDTNLKIFYGGSSAQTPIDLGSGFPITANSVEPYELALFSAPNSGDVHYQVTRLSNMTTASGTITNSGATVLPTNTTLLCPWGYRTNNATALAVGLDVMSAYTETDL